MTESQSRQVKCPQCGRLALYSTENPFRPFCSERCRLIDLGEWASESYRIPAKDSSSDALTSLDDDDYPGEDKH
ncbi:DNA gyrase inhibitor YacG [Bdellovibrio sp.]|uniref:DNA gyrase inhibitor YacG n=1 Tax=Bdellovibrio TaxID=958 RepID=UPI0032219F8E